MFQVGLPYYLGVNSSRSVSIKRQQKRGSIFPETFMSRACFPYGKHCFQCQFLFPRCKLCLPYTAGNFHENASMRAVAKILRAWASEKSSNFCEQFKQLRPNFASTFKLDGTIRYPYYSLALQRHSRGFCFTSKTMQVVLYLIIKKSFWGNTLLHARLGDFKM